MNNVDILLKKAKDSDYSLYKALNNLVEECKKDKHWIETESKKTFMIIQTIFNKLDVYEINVLVIDLWKENFIRINFNSISEFESHIINLVNVMGINTIYINRYGYGELIGRILLSYNIEKQADIIMLGCFSYSKITNDIMRDILKNRRKGELNYGIIGFDLGLGSSKDTNR